MYTRFPLSKKQKIRPSRIANFRICVSRNHFCFFFFFFAIQPATATGLGDRHPSSVRKVHISSLHLLQLTFFSLLSHTSRSLSSTIVPYIFILIFLVLKEGERETASFLLCYIPLLSLFFSWPILLIFIPSHLNGAYSPKARGQLP